MKTLIDVPKLKKTILDAQAFVPPEQLQLVGLFLADFEHQVASEGLGILKRWENDATLSDDDREAARQALRDL